MKKWVGVLMIAMLAAQFTGSVSLRWRRDASNDQKDTGVFAMFSTGLGLVKSVPGIGGVVGFVTNWMSETFDGVEELTNGSIARFIGGALPCEISLQHGMQCTGITKDNDLATHIIKVIDQAPLPGFVKSIIKNLLKALLDPAVDVIFGGVATTSR